jgi:GNAT superfamily N-acetyltransferase
MSLVIEKLTHNNFDKYEKKILQSLKEEYKNTYNLDIDDKHCPTLIDYCLSYMYILVLHLPTSSKILGYFSLSRRDLNKTLNVFSYVLDYFQGHVYIFDVYVFPKYRRKGIGTYLVKQAILTAIRELHAKHLYLYTQSYDLTKFYERNGFSFKRHVKVDNKQSLLLFGNEIKAYKQ